MLKPILHWLQWKVFINVRSDCALHPTVNVPRMAPKFYPLSMEMLTTAQRVVLYYLMTLLHIETHFRVVSSHSNTFYTYMNYAPNQLAEDPNKAGALFAFCLQIDIRSPTIRSIAPGLHVVIDAPQNRNKLKSESVYFVSSHRIVLSRKKLTMACEPGYPSNFFQFSLVR